MSPSLSTLESRELLNAARTSTVPHLRGPAHVEVARPHHEHHSPTKGMPSVRLDGVTANGYTFVSFDGPMGGTNAGAGTNFNGISNAGTSVGFTIVNDGNFHNIAVNPLRMRKAQLLNLNGSTTANAFGINSGGTAVGTDGNGNAFTLSARGQLHTFIPLGGTSATAFGINDHGDIVGQYATGNATPGFL